MRHRESGALCEKSIQWASESLGRRGAAPARVDPHLRAIIDRIGPCRLEPHPDRFGALVRSIISQQISTKAARVDQLRGSSRSAASRTSPRD